MAIKVVCDCGKKLNVKDELEGKRIKCPDCGESLTVGDEHATPSKPTKAKAKKGGMMMWLVLGLGFFVVGFCCVGAGGTGAWYFWPAGSGGSGGSVSGLEGKVVGKWVMDVGLPK